MNIEELREKWHRDAEQAHDWHEAAWDLMRELDDARTEIVRLHRQPAPTENPNKVLIDQMTLLAKERDVFLEDARRAYAERDAARVDLEASVRMWRADWTKAMDERNAARGDLGAMQASLNFALETNKRLKAERDAADNLAETVMQNGATVKLWDATIAAIKEATEAKAETLLMQVQRDEARRAAEENLDGHGILNARLFSDLKRVTDERDEARRQFLNATGSGKWEYSAELELQVSRMTAQIERMQAEWEDLAAKNDDKAMRLGRLTSELNRACQAWDWFAVARALKIAKGRA